MLGKNKDTEVEVLFVQPAIGGLGNSSSFLMPPDEDKLGSLPPVLPPAKPEPKPIIKAAARFGSSARSELEPVLGRVAAEPLLELEPILGTVAAEPLLDSKPILGRVAAEPLLELEPVLAAVPEPLLDLEPNTGSYTIQLLASSNRQKVLNYIQQYDLNQFDPLITEKNVNAKSLYVLTLGQYASKNEALANLSGLSAQIQKQAWIKKRE